MTSSQSELLGPGRKRGVGLVGPLPPPLGGATVLFGLLVDDSVKRQHRYHVIDSNFRSSGRISFALSLVRLLSRRDVSVVAYNMSSRRSFSLFPYLAVLTRLFGKRVVFRGFGGNYDVLYQEAGRFNRWLFTASLSVSSLVLFETRSLVNQFRSIAQRASIEQLPNYRDIPVVKAAPRRWSAKNSFRLVYVGRVCEEKGLSVLLNAFASLPCAFSLDVYGPVDDVYREWFLNSISHSGGRVRYGGVIANDRVPGVIEDSDGLVFPSYWAGEGHPGVILEAYGAFVPTIVAKWRSVPELLPDGFGNAVTVGDAAALAACIERLYSEPESLDRLTHAQFEILRKHDRRYWGEWFLTRLESVC